MNKETFRKIKFCWENGFRIYPQPAGLNHYQIVIAKATKYNWKDIPIEKVKQFEKVDGIVYSLKIGTEYYKTNPTMKDVKWHEKINELYKILFDKLNIKQ